VVATWPVEGLRRSKVAPETLAQRSPPISMAILVHRRLLGRAPARVSASKP
jgi:hypothetical protein